MFKELKNYKNYLKSNSLDKLLQIEIESYGEVEKKATSANYGITSDVDKPLLAELDDLVRLHWLVVSRKVSTILEFGVGYSTAVFDHALKLNKEKYASFFERNLRREDSFKCFSVDASKKWIDNCKRQFKTDLVEYFHSECVMSTFNGRACTFYDVLPNVCPDLIYLDGPDQYSVLGDVRGISTRHPSRLPMAADILALEHFLLPGTLICVDGRTANARFLKANLQRNWSYFHHEEFDQHFFELVEVPLGIWNKGLIDFCLGEKFYERVKS